MLDYRAWIIAGLILLTAAGAYVIWLFRPKATYNARSLSASQHHAEQASPSKTKSLHVDGCNEDFIVSPGELVEPLAIPGASLDQFRSLYGNEAKHEKDGSYTWNEEAFSLTEGSSTESDPAPFVHISVNGQHVIETLDGVELGLDSFGTIFRKMQDKKVEVHERIERGNGQWLFILTLNSACGRKFLSEYTRILPFDPETDREITQLPPSPGLDPGTLRSDVFMNKVAYDYTLVPSNGSNQSTQGTPSEHE